MPRNKDLKRLVRSRMARTGEAYTTARARILRKKKSRPATGDSGAAAAPTSRSGTRRPAAGTSRTAAAAPVGSERTRTSGGARRVITPAAAPTRPPSPSPGELAALAGMSDAAVAARTGRTWPEWAAALDDLGAAALPHRQIAALLHRDHGLTAWWSQTVTVGYERIRGLRDVGQRRDGAYESNRSRTFPVPLARLYRAFATSRTRARWLPGVKWSVRTATPEKSMRLTWPDGSGVDIRFTGRGAAKSQVAIQHRKLPDRARAQEVRAFWGERLDALARLLSPRG